MMNMESIRELLNLYKLNFHEIHLKEIYKWKAVKGFQDRWQDRPNNFPEMLSNSLDLAGNLLDSGNYFPRRMLLKNAEKSPQEVHDLLTSLFDEEVDLKKRIESYRAGFKTINEKNFPGKKSYQDHRAVMVYLSLRYPDRYYLYKYDILKTFCKVIAHPYQPSIGKIENIGQFKNICDMISGEISNDQTLLKLHKNRITEDCYYDGNLNILTQDFIYAVATHLRQKITPAKTGIHINQTKVVNAEDVKTANLEIDFTTNLTNHDQKNRENKKIGDLGENWVIEYEKAKLMKFGKTKLIAKIKHTSKCEGDGAGYDIISYDENGKEIYIEVKTTKGSIPNPFYITRNELERSIKESEKYYLYRLYNFNENKNLADLLIIKGALTHICTFSVQFKVILDC